ncbi:crumbs-like 3b [Silurus meridionalis]|nr:crumbs-like 3b [Silurus meridionalis]
MDKRKDLIEFDEGQIVTSRRAQKCSKLGTVVNRRQGRGGRGSLMHWTMVVVTLTSVHAVPAFLLLLTLVTLLIGCMLRRKRKTEGTYRPSAEEQKQAESQEPEKPGLPLPLPKEERLI